MAIVCVYDAALPVHPAAVSVAVTITGFAAAPRLVRSPAASVAPVPPCATPRMGCLQELEEEKSQLSGKIKLEKATLPVVTKEQVLYWLDSFKQGDVDDKNYQANLFDTFLVAAYLYDDRLKLVFRGTGHDDTFDIQIAHDAVDFDATVGTVDSSSVISFGPPAESTKTACNRAVFVWLYIHQPVSTAMAILRSSNGAASAPAWRSIAIELLAYSNQ